MAGLRAASSPSSSTTIPVTGRQSSARRSSSYARDGAVADALHDHDDGALAGRLLLGFDHLAANLGEPAPRLVVRSRPLQVAGPTGEGQYPDPGTPQFRASPVANSSPTARRSGSPLRVSTAREAGGALTTPRWRQKVRDLDAKCLGDPMNAFERRVGGLPALDAGIGPNGQTTEVRCLFLADVRREPRSERVVSQPLHQCTKAHVGQQTMRGPFEPGSPMPVLRCLPSLAPV